jgi:AcrR family transcriptional regulator
MSPRAYRGDKRRAVAEETRTRILDTALQLLAAEDAGDFSIDFLAKRAGVARMTVYYHFGSTRGLLEAVFDALAADKLVKDLPAAFSQEDPAEALTRLIQAFIGFWASERVAIRRIRALAVLHPVVQETLRDRDERRRQGLSAIVSRLLAGSGKSSASRLELVVDVLHALTSFETYDALARDSRSARDVEQIVRELAVPLLESLDERPPLD